MKQNKLVLFFTDKTYRWITLQWVKTKLCSLPGIRQIITWRQALPIAKKMNNMSPWERHVALKNSEHQVKETMFFCALLRLKVAIMAEQGSEAKKDFPKYKQDVLENDCLNSRELSEFKEWVQQITPDEKDYSKVQAVIDKFFKVE